MIEPHVDERGDWVCEHGTAMDLHCCGCHDGFIFEDHECPDDGEPADSGVLTSADPSGTPNEAKADTEAPRRPTRT